MNHMESPSKDEQWSKQLYQFAQKTSRTRDVAIFCASELIWLMAGFVIGRGYPFILALLPVIFLPWGVALLLAEWIKRPRPYEQQGFRPLIHLFVRTPSFPSSHSTLAFAFVAAFVHDITLWPFLLIAAILVALGRVAVGVHYVSDVLFGALIGLVFGITVRVAALLLN